MRGAVILAFSKSISGETIVFLQNCDIKLVNTLWHTFVCHI